MSAASATCTWEKCPRVFPKPQRQRSAAGATLTRRAVASCVLLGRPYEGGGNATRVGRLAARVGANATTVFLWERLWESRSQSALHVRRQGYE
jgi:hypothetical protein